MVFRKDGFKFFAIVGVSDTSIQSEHWWLGWVGNERRNSGRLLLNPGVDKEDYIQRATTLLLMIERPSNLH